MFYKCALGGFVKRNGIKIQELCDECGISRQQYYNYINNRQDPSIYVAYEIQAFLCRKGHTVDLKDIWY